MNLVITVDWKLVVALGISAVAIILSAKLNPIAAEKALTHMVDVCGGYVVTEIGNC